MKKLIYILTLTPLTMLAQDTGIAFHSAFLKNGEYSGNILYDSTAQCFTLPKDAEWRINIIAASDKPFSVSLQRDNKVIQKASANILDFAKLPRDQTDLISTFERVYPQEGPYANPLYKDDKLCLTVKDCKDYMVSILEVSEFLPIKGMTYKTPKTEVIKVAQQLLNEGNNDSYQITESGYYKLRFEGCEKIFIAHKAGTLRYDDGVWYFDGELIKF